MKITNPYDLIARGLDGFSVKEMTEIFKVDDKGDRQTSLGFLEDTELAQGFAESHPDSKYLRTRVCSILTDGKVGFLLNVKSVTLMNVKAVTQVIHEVALAKLTPIQQRVVQGR